ncbi:DUF3139 domain-containing protein [Cytobacillus firmus]|nr:DUF3139 domain-containing protein [Paenibacillus lautus]MBY0161453.1 DUF3139 domain-containing protein [Cytobacillus firmus]MCI1777539.1 DUF3139 domain-containing protein [Paenibacillus lautus]
MKKIKIALLVLLVLVLLSPFVYVQANKMIYAKKVNAYLLEEEHYTQDEIQSVQGIWGVKLPPFYVVVVFKDEPEVEYIYFAHDTIMQFEYRLTPEGKDRGITRSMLKHVIPRD